MSLDWSTDDLTAATTLSAKSESPSLGPITVPSLPEGNFSPRDIDTAETTIGESPIDDGQCPTTGSSVYAENSLLAHASNVEDPSPASMAGIKTEMQPLHAVVTNSTVSAAADSSDNQPPTPTPDHQHQQQQQQPPSHHHHQQQQQHHQQQHHHPQQQHQHHALYGGGGIANSNQMYQEMHSYHPSAASYLGGYEQFYHAPPAGVDYGSAMQQLQQSSVLSYQMQNQTLTGAASPHVDYKVVPSSQRYHPYLNNGGVHHLSPVGQNHSSVAAVVSVNSGGTVNNASSSVSNSSLSPRVVSSSSPSQNNSSAANTPHHGGGMSDVNSMANRTPTPSASSKQCNKCGIMCATETELNEHYSAIHGAQSGEDCINLAERSASSASERAQYHTFPPYIKEEPPSSDILDLDSQKMVYPPQSEGDVVGGGLHPMQRPMTWPQELHPAAYMAAPHLAENKHSGYYTKQQEFSAIKSEFHPIKSEYVSPTNFGNTVLKSGDYGQPIAPQTRSEDKSFVSTDLATGNNPVSSSPSEFPSTTTPQDNLTQYRGFEPPSSSLPSSGSSAKSATWKSNEARRPKTYNCTACNKWFTSSGHLKRHYNTTLHKNAVKSSGQPDPATMPISAHHHPSRDPNSKHHRNSQSRQPPPIPPEPPRSPDFSSQYTTQSPNGFPSQQQQHSFQQYHPQNNLNSSVNGHPNGLAGPSVQASNQPRGLLTITSTEVSIMDQEEDQLHTSNSSSSNSNLHLQEEQYHQHQEMHQLECSPNNSPNNSNSSLEEYHPSTISLHQQQQSQQQQQQLLLPPLQSPHIISHHQYPEVHPIHQQQHHHQQEPTIFSTATTIHNIMDQQQQQQQLLPQQQYIISPLGISTTTPITLNSTTTTTIPSFQHLQQPVVEHQQNYHTIIGNDPQQLLGQDGSLIQLGSFVDISTLAGTQQTFQGDPHQVIPNPHLVAVSPHGRLHLLQQGVDIQRFSGGIPSFKECVMEASSPAAPESYYNRISPFGSHGSPQEADIPPMYSTASGPQHEQVDPHSPTVSSSTATTNQQNLTMGDKITAPAPDIAMRKPAVKRKRETSNKAATLTTLPTGRIKCVECNKEFTKICYLTQHNKSFHSGEQPYRCQKCGKRFQSEDIYNTHLARHKSQDKPHKCDLCPKQFHHKTDLRRHKEAIHTGFKAHTCDMCNKSFCRKDHLRKHCDIHNRPKPIKKAKIPPVNRKQSKQTTIATATAIFSSAEHNSPNQISNVEDSTNSTPSPSQHIMPKMDIKVESYTIAGEELIYT